MTGSCCHKTNCSVNPLEFRGNYYIISATSNNMKLVHWPLMGGLLHSVQRGGDCAGQQPTQAPPLCTKCNSPPINGQVYQSRSPYCCIMVRCSAVLMWPLKGYELYKPCVEFSSLRLRLLGLLKTPRFEF